MRAFLRDFLDGLIDCLRVIAEWAVLTALCLMAGAAGAHAYVWIAQ